MWTVPVSLRNVSQYFKTYFVWLSFTLSFCQCMHMIVALLCQYCIAVRNVLVSLFADTLFNRSGDMCQCEGDTPPCGLVNYIIQV